MDLLMRFTMKMNQIWTSLVLPLVDSTMRANYTVSRILNSSSHMIKLMCKKRAAKSIYQEESNKHINIFDLFIHLAICNNQRKNSRKCVRKCSWDYWIRMQLSSKGFMMKLGSYLQQRKLRLKIKCKELRFRCWKLLSWIVIFSILWGRLKRYSVSYSASVISKSRGITKPRLLPSHLGLLLSRLEYEINRYFIIRKKKKISMNEKNPVIMTNCSRYFL